VRALLLDLDDTLLDYSSGVDAHWEAAVVACAPTGVDRTRLLSALAETRRWFWEDPERHRRERVNMLAAWQHIVEFALQRLGVVADGLAPAIARDFAARRRDAMRLFPDTVESLEAFRHRGVPLALVTNGDASQQRDKIERHRLARFFDVILIEGEFGVGKPDASVYRHVLGALGEATACRRAAPSAPTGSSAHYASSCPINRASSGAGGAPRTSAGCRRRPPQRYQRGMPRRSRPRRQRRRAAGHATRTSARRGSPGSDQRWAHSLDNTLARRTACPE
jgi:putative hydrolase of the HAD superfamily